MKFSFEKIMKHIEWLTIYVGVFTLVLSLFGIDCIYLTGLASVLFIVYFSYRINKNAVRLRTTFCAKVAGAQGLEP